MKVAYGTFSSFLGHPVCALPIYCMLQCCLVCKICRKLVWLW